MAMNDLFTKPMQPNVSQLLEQLDERCEHCGGPLEQIYDPLADEYENVCKNPDCPLRQ